jgi:N-acetylmuramic acid 6-phosphate etherase
MTSILDLLELRPSDESLDFIRNKGQFHLFTLLTEQRHEHTMRLGYDAAADTQRALEQILDVDEDIVRRFETLAQEPAALERMAAAMAAAIREGRRIYFYGCGATGRLAKQMESSFWRPFWKRLRAGVIGAALAERIDAVLPRAAEELVVGEMTGADRALVVSLEGFEDLQLLGALQLSDHGIRRGDLVICVTEGGETSSVIGTILAARAQWEDSADAREHLFFVYNNPDELLRPFERSVRVLDEPGITKICLATGPQALAGSTRMQATTSETYLLGIIMEHALDEVLRGALGDDAIRDLGFGAARSVSERLLDFVALQRSTRSAAPALAPWTEAESGVYAGGRFANYCASRALVTVFTDCTERSPTFRLLPLDTVEEEVRRSWVAVHSEGEDAPAAWRHFLGRPFRGLSSEHYAAPLRDEVQDPYLRRAALLSLANAGQDQEAKYDFSFAPHKLRAQLSRDSGQRGQDLMVLVTVGDEVQRLHDPRSLQRRYLELARELDARCFCVHVDLGGPALPRELTERSHVSLRLPFDMDPLEVRQHIALKILLNAHSTCTMARLGRVVGNTMTGVSPSNLKLVGRASFLIESHVQEQFARRGWGEAPSFAECNAVLYDAMAWTAEQGHADTAEVALSIVRILEARRRNGSVTWDDAARLLQKSSLAAYLEG